MVDGYFLCFVADSPDSFCVIFVLLFIFRWKACTKLCKGRYCNLPYSMWCDNMPHPLITTSQVERYLFSWAVMVQMFWSFYVAMALQQ